MSVTDAAGTLHVVANLTPAYSSSGVISNWQRTLDLDAFGLTVHDSWSAAGGVTAIFQIQTPEAPIVTANGIVAGALRIRPIVPANPTVTVLDWTTVDPTEFLSGYRIDLAGGSGTYEVRLELLDALFADGFESGNTSAWTP